VSDRRQKLSGRETLPRPVVHRDDFRVSGGSPARQVVARPLEGYVVVEEPVGRATAQWLLQVRCECGQRWFERGAIEAAQCTGCGRLVFLEIESSSE
jgi:hypothetical protein